MPTSEVQSQPIQITGHVRFGMYLPGWVSHFLSWFPFGVSHFYLGLRSVFSCRLDRHSQATQNILFLSLSAYLKDARCQPSDHVCHSSPIPRGTVSTYCMCIDDLLLGGLRAALSFSICTTQCGLRCARHSWRGSCRSIAA